MKTRLALIGAALLALFAAPVSAAPFSAIYAFGDSLSDAGNAYIATDGKSPPAPPYALVNGFGVSSNGPVWVQNLAGKLGLGALLPSLAGGTDFAVGGAQTGAFGAYAGSPGDLLPAPGNPAADSQLGMFAADVPHPAAHALYTLSIGSVDLANIFTLDSGNPAQATADATAVLRNIGIFIGDLTAAWSPLLRCAERARSRAHPEGAGAGSDRRRRSLGLYRRVRRGIANHACRPRAERRARPAPYRHLCAGGSGGSRPGIVRLDQCQGCLPAVRHPHPLCQSEPIPVLGRHSPDRNRPAPNRRRRRAGAQRARPLGGWPRHIRAHHTAPTDLG